jgi:hypothetical protein
LPRLRGLAGEARGSTTLIAAFLVPMLALLACGAVDLLQGSPYLVINANYAGSTVPVPGGVGSNYSSGRVTLTR